MFQNEPYRSGLLTLGTFFLLPFLIGSRALMGEGVEPLADPPPPSWEILPIPRDADYGAPGDFVTLDRVAIVRKAGGPYQTVRDEKTELVGDSTITEEELIRILGEHGVTGVDRLPDDRASYEDYTTLILLGSPQHNRQTARFFRDMKLSFAAWDDPRTPEDDFTSWSDFGSEGYLLKTGRSGKQSIVILAGHDFDDRRQRFHGAGTFYALQSFRQLIISDGGVVKVKTAEVADRPLLAARGCMSGFDPRPEKQWRDIEFLPRIKANQNVYWYGNALGGYSSQSAGKFRYPWTPEQLELFSGFGKYCRERYVTMVFCMNPDHYNVDWAAAKTFDGSRKDPLHYDPDYQAEPEFREMWAKLGHDVQSDIDILAAKFGQIHRVIPGVMFQMMNEDDGFGLFNEADQKLFNTKTGDPKKDAINYGRARAKFLVALYRRIKQLYPDSADYLPLCPPGQLPYQLVLERDEAYSREFLGSFGSTLKKEGLQEFMPVLTTGGGTAAEVINAAHLDRFHQWSNGCQVLLHDNNFAGCSKVGAYETDPKGPRSPHQANPDYPAGYRDPELYKRMWGSHWNGVPDQVVLGWCQSQFMWNMLALERKRVNALATRKVSSASSYSLVKSYLEEFDNPAAYLPDNHAPYRVKVISDRITFPAKGWPYVIDYTDARRKECQRLRDKLGRLLPELEAKWENQTEKRASLDELGYSAYSFSSVYLAYGYIKGWEKPSSEDPTDRLEGSALRDLYLEAENFQELYFAGPDVVDGKKPLNNHYYSGTINYIYTDGMTFTVPKTPAEAKIYVDIWDKGLESEFFTPVSATKPAALPDEDPRLGSGWGAVEESGGETFRRVESSAQLAIDAKGTRRLLVRARLGTDATVRSASTSFRLSTGKERFPGVVCKPRWFSWLLPEGVDLSGVSLQAEGPIRVYQVEIYREKDAALKTPAGETSVQRLREKAIVSTGDTARLQHVLARARRGEPIVVGAIGGSITQGAMAKTEEDRWPNRVAQWWRDSFPDIEVTLVNAGIGATGSDIGAHRAQFDLLPKDPDLVVVEFAVNDKGSPIAAQTLEGLLRQILRHRKQPAVVMLFTMDNAGRNIQAAHAPIGEHYGIPMVSYRDALWPEIEAERITWKDLSPDTVHPNSRGHAYCADFIAGVLDGVLAKLPPESDLPPRSPLPEPLESDTFETTSIYGYENLQPTRNEGWQASKRDGSGTGWEANTPGSLLEFEVEGDAVSIIYYRTQGDRGMAEAWIDDGDPVQMDAWFVAKWNFAAFQLVEQGLGPGKHRLRIRVLDDRNEASAGHRFQIHSVLTAGLDP